MHQYVDMDKTNTILRQRWSNLDVRNGGDRRYIGNSFGGDCSEFTLRRCGKSHVIARKQKVIMQHIQEGEYYLTWRFSGTREKNAASFLALLEP